MTYDERLREILGRHIDGLSWQKEPRVTQAIADIKALMGEPVGETYSTLDSNNYWVLRVNWIGSAPRAGIPLYAMEPDA